MTIYSGPIGVASGIPPTIDEANPSHELGDKIYTADGRAFRYVNAGETLVVGDLLEAPAEDTTNQSVLTEAVVVGATTVVTAGNVTVTANEYVGGFIVVTGEGGTGTGFMYQIKSHPAATAAVVTLTLNDPVQVAFTAATQIDLVKNPYNGVIQQNTTPTSCVVGVAINEITSGQHGWIQVEGIAVLKNDATGAIVVGNNVVASGTTVGSCRAAANDTTELFAIVGTAVTGINTSERGAVKLNIGG